DRIKSAKLYDKDNVIKGELTDGTQFKVAVAANQIENLTTQFNKAAFPFEVVHQHDSVWLSLLLNFLPFLLLLGVFLFVMNSMQGGGNRVMQFGKAKPRTMSKDQPKVTFADVAGSDEAVEELHEIKEFLESPGKFQAMGAKIPKGVLLYGPPGTGKTLLA